jgi:hypothetical protein
MTDQSKPTPESNAKPDALNPEATIEVKSDPATPNAVVEAPKVVESKAEASPTPKIEPILETPKTEVKTEAVGAANTIQAAAKIEPISEAPKEEVSPKTAPQTPASVEPKPALEAVKVAEVAAAIVDIDESDEEIEDLDEDDVIEAYCVKCRVKVEMTNREAVWTSKGTPGTRGVCPNCGTVIFRMGKTPAHDKLVRPAAVKVEGTTKIATAGGRKKAQPATYINHAPGDTEFARKLATDLENAGVHTWIDNGETPTGNVKWAGGVHPALKDSARMVVVLSPGGKDDAELVKTWTFFKTQKKPIVVAMTHAVEVPDALRRNPRFDFSADYKSALRQLMSALSE